MNQKLFQSDPIGPMDVQTIEARLLDAQDASMIFRGAHSQLFGEPNVGRGLSRSEKFEQNVLAFAI